MICPACVPLANFFGGWDIVLVLAIILILFAAKKLPDRFERFGRGMRDAMKNFRDATDEVSRELRDTKDAHEDPPASEPTPSRPNRKEEFILWLARGLDVGRIPVAPGTFGSLVGLLWAAVLLLPGSLLVYFLGAVAGLALSVWCCGEAERILGATDPPSVVLDEIVAMPLCFLPWIWHARAALHAMPPVETFWADKAWLGSAGVFVLFRFFDVSKPWPVRQSQSLPGGWGVTVDDVLASAYTAGVSALFLFFVL